MKRVFFVFIAFTLSSFFNLANANNEPVIELKKILKQSPKTFVSEAKNLLSNNLSSDNQLAVLAMLIDKLQQEAKFEQANLFNEKLKILAEQENLTFYVARYWLFRSVAESANTKDSNKLKYIQTGLELAKSAKHQSTIQMGYNLTGAYYRIRDQYALAESAYLQALHYSTTEAEKAANLNQLATLAKNQNQFEVALDHLNQALAIYSQLQDDNGIANTLYSLASTNNKLGHYELAASQYEESYELDKKLGNKHNQIYSAIRLCFTYGLLEKFEKAIQACNEGKELSIKLGTSNIPWANNTLSSVYITQQEFGKIVPLMEQNIREYTDKMSPWVHVRTHQFLSRALSHLERHEQAEKANKKALNLATEYNLAALVEDNYSELAHNYKRAGKYEQAFEYLTKYQKVKNDREKKADQSRIKELKNNIAFLNKEREAEQERIQRLEAQALVQKQQTQMQLVILGSIIVFTIFIGLFYTVRQKRTLAEKERALLGEYLEKKKQLLADVSHELRTPITGIKLQIESLQMNLEDDVQLSYQVIQDRLNNLNMLINDVYQLSRVDSGVLELNYQPVVINELAEDLNDEFEKQVSAAGLVFNFTDTTNQPTTLDLDPERIEQVLINLVNNSCLYTDAPGTVQLTLSKDTQQFCIELVDSSPTVPSTDLDMIFDRLYRVESSRSRETGGSGLGLAICKSLIEAQGGNISATQSELGGLKIKITFPL